MDFLQGRVGREHTGENVLKATAIDHRFAGTGDVDRPLTALHVVILGFGGVYAVPRVGSCLPVFHDAAQFFARVFQLVDAWLLPESGAAHFGNQHILLTHGLDVDRKLVQLGQQDDLAVVETAGLLDQAVLDTGNQLV
ncbi:hypothetical protein D3C75_934160 [compost metagenome]